jgi:5-methylcytosine-specific restriction endonuclease McrA
MSKLGEDTGFYKSMAWRETRKNYRQSVGGLCERCMERGIIQTADLVHHIVPLTTETVSDPNLSLNWDNLQALCRKCHAEVHEEIYAKRAKRRYKVDENGRVEIRDDTVL